MNNKRLSQLCLQKLKEKSLSGDYLSRLKAEMKEVVAQDSAEYFLDLYDRGIKYPENQHNLLVPFLLGIVDNFDISAEPAYAYGEMPDIDVDYLRPVRDYLKNEWAPKHYGSQYVCNIGSYGSYGMRSSLIDVAKIFGEDRDRMLEITKNLPDKDEEGDKITWETALEIYPALKDFCDNNPEIFEVARAFSESEYGSRNKSMGKHAGGLIVSSIPLADLVPLVVDKDGLITSGWTEGLHAQDLGPVGLIKFDCLVITNLQQIADIVELVKRRHKLDAICSQDGKTNWSDISYLNDPKSIAMANEGDLKCIFQFDSAGIRALTKAGGVTDFEDLVAYTALYRPGPLGMGMSEKYVKRKKGEEEYELHPILEPILGKTYGVQTYQEQVMKILHAVGGIPLKDCEKVRKAISKKKEEVFVKYEPQFIEIGSERLQRDCELELQEDYSEVVRREFSPSEDMEWNLNRMADYPHKEGMQNPYPKSMGYVAGMLRMKYPDVKISSPLLHKYAAAGNARALWNQIEAFAAYGFNASHAVAYTYISSRLLYLKANYPVEFYAGILKNETKEAKIKEYKTEAAIHGVEIRPLDLNHSKVFFEIYQEDEEPRPDDPIYFGFSNIKGIGEGPAEKIVEGQPYKGFDDFLFRFGTDAGTVKPLVCLRLFDDGELPDLWRYYEIYKKVAKNRRDREARYGKALIKYDEELKELLESEEVDWDESNLEVWQEKYNVDEIREEVCTDAGSAQYGQIMQKKFNRWKKLKSLYNRRKKTMVGFAEKEKEAEENPFTFSKYRPDLSEDEVFIGQEMQSLFNNVETAQEKFLGFLWDHPLVKSPDFTNLTYAGLRELLDDNPNIMDGPVEILVIEIRRRDWKNGKGYNYTVTAEDANGERNYITVWPDDFERFNDELTEGKLLRLRVQPPTKYGYTLDGPPKWKRHTLPEKDKDVRVVTLRYPVEEII